METDKYSPLLCTVFRVFLLACQQVFGSVFIYQPWGKHLNSVVHPQMKLPQYAVLFHHWPMQKFCKILVQNIICKLRNCAETIKHIGRGVISTLFIQFICTVQDGHFQTQTCKIIALLAVTDCCVHGPTLEILPALSKTCKTSYFGASMY